MIVELVFILSLTGLSVTNALKETEFPVELDSSSNSQVPPGHKISFNLRGPVQEVISSSNAQVPVEEVASSFSTRVPAQREVTSSLNREENEDRSSSNPQVPLEEDSSSSNSQVRAKNEVSSSSNTPPLVEKSSSSNPQEPVEEDISSSNPQEPVEEDSSYSNPQEPVEEDSSSSNPQEPFEEDTSSSNSQEPFEEDTSSSNSQEPIEVDSSYSNPQEPVEEDSSSSNPQEPIEVNSSYSNPQEPVEEDISSSNPQEPIEVDSSYSNPQEPFEEDTSSSNSQEPFEEDISSSNPQVPAPREDSSSNPPPQIEEDTSPLPPSETPPQRRTINVASSGRLRLDSLSDLDRFRKRRKSSKLQSSTSNGFTRGICSYEKDEGLPAEIKFRGELGQKYQVVSYEPSNLDYPEADLELCLAMASANQQQTYTSSKFSNQKKKKQDSPQQGAEPSDERLDSIFNKLMVQSGIADQFDVTRIDEEVPYPDGTTRSKLRQKPKDVQRMNILLTQKNPKNDTDEIAVDEETKAASVKNIYGGDYFKSFGNILGNAVGKVVESQMASEISNKFNRRGDTRFGGDIFGDVMGSGMASVFRNSERNGFGGLRLQNPSDTSYRDDYGMDVGFSNQRRERPFRGPLSSRLQQDQSRTRNRFSEVRDKDFDIISNFRPLRRNKHKMNAIRRIPTRQTDQLTRDEPNYLSSLLPLHRNNLRNRFSSPQRPAVVMPKRPQMSLVDRVKMNLGLTKNGDRNGLPTDSFNQHVFSMLNQFNDDDTLRVFRDNPEAVRTNGDFNSQWASSPNYALRTPFTGRKARSENLSGVDVEDAIYQRKKKQFHKTLSTLDKTIGRILRKKEEGGNAVIEAKALELSEASEETTRYNVLKKMKNMVHSRIQRLEDRFGQRIRQGMQGDGSDDI